MFFLFFFFLLKRSSWYALARQLLLPREHSRFVRSIRRSTNDAHATQTFACVLSVVSVTINTNHQRVEGLTSLGQKDAHNQNKIVYWGKKTFYFISQRSWSIDIRSFELCVKWVDTIDKGHKDVRGNLRVVRMLYEISRVHARFFSKLCGFTIIFLNSILYSNYNFNILVDWWIFCYYPYKRDKLFDVFVIVCVRTTDAVLLWNEW